MCDIPEKDLYWLAGLLEGEASFHLACNYHRGNNQAYPVIKLKMCDRDIVERAAILMKGTPDVLHHTRPNPKHNDTYTIYVIGTKAVPWLHLLRPLMGARRREQIDTILAGMTPQNQKRCKKLDMDKAREIRALWAERTMTQIEIAALFGVSKWTVFDVINGYRWAGDEPAEHRKYRCKLDDEQAQEIKRLREDRGMTLADIAELYGVHKSTIGRLLARS